MSKNTSWKNIGIMRICKYLFFICFIILLFGTLGSFILYLFPDLTTNISPVYSDFSDFISAYALYLTFINGIMTIIMFCSFKYIKSKLEQVESDCKKTSPDVMNELVRFGRRRNEIIAKINSVKEPSELQLLRKDVDEYNNEAQEFAEINGVTPILITYSDFDSKISQ